MKIAGILGGFGTESTAKFQLEIVEIFRARKLKKRPPLLIWQAPIPINIERNLIINSRGISNFLPFLIDGTQRLKNGGADFIVLPCNTLHILLDNLRKTIDLPIINLIKETVERLNNKKVKRVGIVASQKIISSGLHQRCLQINDIEPILPTKSEQNLINKVINQVLANKNLKNVKEKLQSIIENLRDRGTKDVLLACTDLQQAVPEVKGVKIHDTLHILAEATVRKILKERR
jgi:aspartate racemase